MECIDMKISWGFTVSKGTEVKQNTIKTHSSSPKCVERRIPRAFPGVVGKNYLPA